MTSLTGRPCQRSPAHTLQVFLQTPRIAVKLLLAEFKVTGKSAFQEEN